MTDHEKLKALMKERGLNYFDIAKITGHSYNSVKSMLQPNRELPRWVNLVLYVWEGCNAKRTVCDCCQKNEARICTECGAN